MLMQHSGTNILEIPSPRKVFGKYWEKDFARITDSDWFPSEAISDKGRYLAIKGTTGYGGTTAALNDTQFCNIIATPNTSHVLNKKAKLGANGGAGGFRIFYIYADSSDRWKDVLKYASAGRKFHVYTTFANLTLALSDYKNELLELGEGIEEVSPPTRIIIDEYQQLWASSGYAESTSKLVSHLLEFKNLILTSASYPKFQHHKLISSLRKEFTYNPKHTHKRQVNLIKGGTEGNVIKRAQANLEKGISTYIFTNEVKVFQAFLNQDVLTGEALGLKIAFYHGRQSTTIDPSKKIHIISSAGYEGIDIEDSDCEAIIYGRYTKGEEHNHLLIGELDLYQILGRFRNGYKTAYFYPRKSDGFNQYIDLKAGEVKALSEKLTRLKKSGDLEAYYSLMPTLQASAEMDKILDVHDLTRQSRFSPKIQFTIKLEHKVEKFKLAGLSPSEMMAKVSLKDAKHIAANPFDYMAYKKLNNEDKTKRTGYQSGLNIDDLLIYLIRDLIGEDEALLRLVKVFDENLTRRGRIKLTKGVFDALSFFVLTDEHSAFYEKELADRNFNIEYLSEKITRFNGFQRALIQRFNTLTCTVLGTGLDEYPKVYNLAMQPTDSQVTKLRFLSDKIFNYIWLYSARMDKGTPIREDFEQVATEYLKTEKAKERQAQRIKEGLKPMTITSLTAEHREYLKDLFLALGNKEGEFAIVKDDREYSKITAHPSALRGITPSQLIELDFRTLNPRIAGMWLDSQGFPELLAKVEQGDVYDIKNTSRDKAKVKVNTALNLHSKHERREKNFIEIGMRPDAAQVFADAFKIKGSFFRFATSIEKQLCRLVADAVEMNQAQTTRLHDAVLVQRKTIEAELPESVKIRFNGKDYTYPLGTTFWN